MIVQRTETHIIKESHPIYNWIVDECLRSRNLYNKTLFIYRQAFTGNHDRIEDFKPIIEAAVVNEEDECKESVHNAILEKIQSLEEKIDNILSANNAAKRKELSASAY